MTDKKPNALQLADKLENYSAFDGEWISVKDRMPEPNTSDEYIKHLLDTNLHLCRSLEMVIKTWIEGKGTDECRVKALKLARAAIAKAEGEKS